MRHFQLFFIILMSMIPGPIVLASGSCTIDGKLSPQLGAYVQEINTFSATLRQLPSSCGAGKSTTIIPSSQRTLDTIEKAKIEIPTMGRLDSDFAYNIQMAFKGESRDAVVKNGKIFGKVEQTLIATLDVLAGNCNLDSTNEEAIRHRIHINDLLENLYQETAIGYPGINTDEIPDTYETLVTEIQQTYNPTATQGCKNQFSLEEMASEIMNKMSAVSLRIEDSLYDWKYAIALLRGSSAMKQEEYSRLKTRLLASELRRQGYSIGAIDQMVSGYSCIESSMQGDEKNIIMDFAQAKVACARMSILGVDRFMRTWNRMILGSNGAKTIGGYLNRYTSYHEVSSTNVDTEMIFNEIDSMTIQDTPINDDFLTQYIDLHISLLDLNERIEKRIDPMLNNCRKAQTDIPCNF